MSGGNNYEQNTVASITATPNAGYVCTSLGSTYYSDDSTGAKTISFTVTSDATISATFAKFYNVVYHRNHSGSDTTTATQSPLVYGKTYSLNTLAALGWTRTGYKFGGWATSASGSAAYTDGQSVSNLSSTAGATVDLYAVWIRYTLTYDANGGSSTPAAQSYYGNITLAAAITRPGYMFGGWQINGATYTAGGTYNLTADATATAKWTAYTVTYNTHGGSACSAGSGVVTLPTTTRTGYTFNGWYTAESGGTKVGNAGASYTPTANVTLHAQWTGNAYELTFDNLFVYGEWQASASNALNSGGGDPAAILGTDNGWPAIYCGGRQHVYNKYGAGSSYYNIPVTPGTTYYFECTVKSFTNNGTTYPLPASSGAQVFYVPITSEYGYARSQSDKYVALTSAVKFASGETSKKATGTFTAPDNCQYVQLFFDVHDAGCGASFRLIRLCKNDPYGEVSVDKVRQSYRYQDNKTYAQILTSVTNVMATATRAGRTFLGWFTAESGGSQVTADTTAAAANTNLYSRWQEQSNLTLSLGEHITKIYYKINGASNWSSTTENKTLAVDNGSTWYAYATAETGYLAYYGSSSSPYTATKSDSAQSVTFEAYAKQSALTFDFRGGTGTPATGKKATYGSSMPALAAGDLPTGAPTQGYQFAGFYDATSGGTKYYNSNGGGARTWDKNTTGGTTLYAQYAASLYTVTFNGNGGTSTEASREVQYDNTYGKDGELPTATRTGYTFAGWWTAASGGTQVTDDTTVTITGDQTLYAHWTGKQYTVTLSKSNGSGGTDSVTATYGSPMPTPCVAPTRNGYTFGGYWTTVVNPDGVQYYDGSMNSVRNWDFASAKTLYAKWTANTININYELDGGSWGQITHPTQMQYNVATAVNVPAKEHYVFAGWTISGYKSGAVWGKTSSPATAINASTVAIGDTPTAAVYFKNLAVANNSTVTLTAHWTRKSYLVNVENSSIVWTLHILHDGTSVVDVAANAGGVNGTGQFTALAGETYTVEARFLQKYRQIANANYYVPYRARKRRGDHAGSSSYIALSRVTGSVSEPAIFAGTYTFSDNETYDEIAIDYVNSYQLTTQVDEGYNPLGETLRPTMQFAYGTGTQIKVTAAETNGSAFIAWTDASGTVIGTNREIIIPASGDLSADVTIKSRYQLQRETVTAAVDARSLAVSALAGASGWVTVKQDSTTVTDVGYGQSATWTMAPTGGAVLGQGALENYGFAGWYDANGNRLATNTSYTKTNITSPVTLYARFTAKIKIDKETYQDGDGSVAVDGTPVQTFPYAKMVPIGDSFGLTAEANSDSHFGGWWLGTNGNRTARLAWTNEQGGGTVTDTANYCVYFMTAAEVFYVALYSRDLRDQAPYANRRAKFTVSGMDISDSSSPIREITRANFELLAGTTARNQLDKTSAGLGPLYLEVEGIRKLTVTVNMSTGYDFQRITALRLPEVEGSAETTISDQPGFSAVINSNYEFVADVGDITRYTLTVSAPTASGTAGGSAKVGNEATEITAEANNGESGKFEKNKTATAIALPENGYRFAGWYTSSSFAGSPVSTEPVYAFAITANTTLYAKFARASMALYKWEGSSNYKQLVWQSKVYTLSKPANLTSVRVDATTLNEAQPAYPIARFKYEAFSSPQAGATASGTVDFNSANTRLADDRMRRLPARRPERYFQVEIDCVGEVDAITIGTSGEGLAQ